MTMQSLVPAGDFRATYAADTVIFPTATAAALLAVALLCLAPLRLGRVRAQHAHPDRLYGDRGARPEYPGRLHRPDLDRPRGLLRPRRVRLGLSERQAVGPGVLRDPAGRARHCRGRAGVRPAGRAAEGLYLAIATLAAQYILLDFFARARWFTGGVAGARRRSLFGSRCRRPRVFLRRARLCGRHASCRRQPDAPRDGRALVAVRDHYLSAEIMGINLAHYRTLSFGLAAFYAGIGGALYAHYLLFVARKGSPSPSRSSSSAMVIIGGLGSIMGS